MESISLKVRAFGLFLFFLSFDALAVHAPFKQGFYIGGALGAGWGHATWDGMTDIYAINDQLYPIPQMPVSAHWTPEGDTSDRVFLGRAMLGYQFVFKRLYLAFETGGTFSDNFAFESNETQTFFSEYNHSTIDASGTTHDSVTLNGSEFNVDIKSGGLITQHFLAYARVGFALNRLTMNSDSEWSTTNATALNPAPYTLTTFGSDEDSSTVAGIRLGVGAEVMATSHLGFTFDYIYTYYGSVNTLSSGDIANVPPPPLFYSVSGTHAPEITVSSQTAMLGVLYHW